MQSPRERPEHASTLNPRATLTDRDNNVLEGNSRNTSDDTVSTLVDSDLEGDTIATQGTAATELSQSKRPSPSTVIQPLAVYSLKSTEME